MYCGIIDEHVGQPADVPGDVEKNLDDFFAREETRKSDPGSSFTAVDRLVIAIALARLS